MSDDFSKKMDVHVIDFLPFVTVLWNYSWVCFYDIYMDMDNA